jgi:hypothetical protein
MVGAETWEMTRNAGWKLTKLSGLQKVATFL